MKKIIDKPFDKVLRPSISGSICYCRVSITRKIMGTGPLDSEILINSGIPLSMSDLSYHLPTGAYSLDNTLASQKDYCASFSTTRLLQLLYRHKHFPLKEMEVVKRILTFAMDNCVFLLL